MILSFSSLLSYDTLQFSTEQSLLFAGKFEDLTHSVGGDIFVLDDKTIYIQVGILNSSPLILNYSSSIPWSSIPRPQFLDTWSSIPHSWSLIPRPWSLILNSSSLILDPWYSIPRPQFLDLDPQFLILDPWSSTPRPWSLILNSSSSIPWYLILDSSFLILDPWFLVLDPWPSIPRHWSLVLYHDPWQWQILWRDDLDPDDKWKLKSGCCSLSPCSAIVLWCYIARVLLWVELHWVVYIGARALSQRAPDWGLEHRCAFFGRD